MTSRRQDASTRRSWSSNTIATATTAGHTEAKAAFIERASGGTPDRLPVPDRGP